MASGYGLQGQAAIVTGSTSGIGQALAGALAAEGVHVVLNGFGDAAAIEKDRAALAERTGVRVLHHGADMTRPGEIADMVAFAHRELGRLDILVNNAGVQHVAPVDAFPIEKWDQIIAINLSSASPKPLSTTAEPAAASARAMPSPMPLVEPVTSETLPASARDMSLRGSGVWMFMSHVLVCDDRRIA